MSSFGLLRFAVAASFLGLAAACTAAPDDGAASSVDDIQTATAIAPIDLLHCWIAPDTEASSTFFQEHEFKCKRPEAGDYPLLPKDVTVVVHTAKNNSLDADVEDGEATIGRFSNEDLPLRVFMKARFDRSSTVGDMFGLKEERQVTALAEATAEKPLAYKSPFTLWGVAIKAPNGLRSVSSSPYEVPTGAFKVGYNFTIPDDDPSVLAVHPKAEPTDGQLEIALIAPESGPISLFLDGQPVAIAGPGSYVFDGSALTKEAGPAPVIDEPSAAPTCGVEGQPRCPDGSCAAGHRLDSGACKPCGADGQTYCGTYNTRTCEPGHRVVNDTCQVCGRDGQTYCGTYNTRTCEPGHRVVNDTCQVCGGQGQTYCGTYNTRTCNEGLRVSGDICTSG